MIEIEKVSKHYRRNAKERKKAGGERLVTAVDNVSFVCQPGAVTTLLGPNGAGKTTLLRMIATLLQPDTGTIRINGYETRANSEEARAQIGFLTGSAGLYERLTGRETLSYFGQLQGMTRDALKQRTAEIVDLLNLQEFIDRRVGKLSTGMKQRISIARTIIHDPSVIIFDEPTCGLDVLAAQSVMKLIENSRSRGRTVIFSTHRMDEASLLSDHLVVIHKGHKIFDSPFSEFRDRSAPYSTMEAAFIHLLEEEQ